MRSVCCYCKCTPEIASRTVAVLNMVLGTLVALHQVVGMALPSFFTAYLATKVILLLEAVGMVVFG